jgi:hypothetical protein
MGDFFDEASKIVQEHIDETRPMTYVPTCGKCKARTADCADRDLRGTAICMSLLTGINKDSPPRAVKHSELTRVGDSRYKSDCPECGVGTLLVRREEKSLRLEAYDTCILCAQRFTYSDILQMREAEEDPLDKRRVVKCNCEMCRSKGNPHLHEGNWWFWDETGANRCGPYATKSKAQAVLTMYCADALDDGTTLSVALTSRKVAGVPNYREWSAILVNAYESNEESFVGTGPTKDTAVADLFRNIKAGV